jgi:N-acetylglucosamine-6-sulfatase
MLTLILLSISQPKGRHTMKMLLYGALISVFSAMLVTSPDVHAETIERPNIVVVEVDDMRADELWVMAQTLALFPGTQFTNSYVSTSLCCPSRAALLSGQYATNNKAIDNYGFTTFDHTNTLATWLQSSGYFTSLVGKYMNRYTCAKKTPPGWSHWQALCAGVPKMYDYTIKDRTTNVVESGYQTDVIAARAVATVDEAHATGKPLFLWVTPTAPHTGPNPRVAPRHATALSTWQPTRGPNFNEADITDKPAWVRSLTTIGSSAAKVLTTKARTRLRMLLAVDDAVAALHASLVEHDMVDNTVFVFTSDNGYMQGEHRIKSGKLVAYSESVRVPLLISGPGIPTQSIDEPVINTDLAPTFTELAQVTPGRAFDGVSVLPVINGASSANRALYHTIVPHNVSDVEGPIHPGGDGVRVGRYVLLELTTGERELYDAVLDPYELNDLSGTAAYADTEAALYGTLTALRTCAGETCRL